MRTVGILVAAAVSLVSLHARADGSRAWTAAKAALPADAKIVVGIDLAAIQKTQLFATLYAKLHDKPDAAKVLDAIKDTCKLDPLAIVAGVVVALAADQSEGAVYVALTGADRAKVSSCLQAAPRAADKAAKVSIKQDGNVTELTENTETSFFGWIGKDVLVVASHVKDKAALVKWMSGKGALARSELGKTLAKVNTAAPLWGAGEATKEIEPGVTLKGGYGTVTFAGGNLSADVHGMMASPDQATTMATMAGKQLAEAKTSAGLPPPIAAMMKAVTITAAKDEVIVKASVVEKDLLGLLAMAMAGAGGP